MTEGRGAAAEYCKGGRARDLKLDHLEKAQIICTKEPRAAPETPGVRHRACGAIVHIGASEQQRLVGSRLPLYKARCMMYIR